MTAVPDHVPGERVIPFDFRNDPRIRRDPWGFFHSVNELPEIFYSPDLGGHWVLGRAALLEEAWSRPDLFSAKSVSIPHIENSFPLIPINLDPPEHRPYQQIFMRQMFAPRIMDGLIDEFRQMTRDAIEAFAPHGAVDVAEAYARPVPINIFLRMIGVPQERRAAFTACIERVFRGKTPDEIKQGMFEVAGLLDAWLDEELADRDSAREAHMLEAILRAEIDGRLLSKDEISRIATMLMLAGLDTTTAATLHTLAFLAGNPGHRQQLIDDPSLVPMAVEELLRRFSIANVARTASCDFTFHGVDFRQGDMILFSTPIAGLDESRFERSLEVDFSRPNVKRDTLAFGTGVHMCSGHNLARRELRVTLEEVLPRLPNLRLAPGADIEYASGGTVTICSALPLVWDAA
jgi:cytochrome P450